MTAIKLVENYLICTDGLRPGRPRDVMTVDPTMLGRNVLDVFQGRLLISAASRPEDEESRARGVERLVFVTGFFEVLRQRVDVR